MTISSIGRRVALVGSLAMLVALLPLAASAQPTGPVLRDLQVNEELEASESVQASILWSQEAFADDSADEVLIATDADFADALASGVLQGDAPLLYTDGDSVDDLVLEEIERLGATSATILGGEVAVSSDVEDALTDAGLEVSRLEGESRIETAVAIAEQELEGDTVFLARAFGTETDPTQAFADNLALGGWAADSGIPVLLTQTDVLTGNTRAFLEANTDVTNVTVVGGEAAISEDVVAELEELGLTVERVEGENRFGTAVAIAEARGLAAADVDQAVFVEGQADDAYINGLAAAAYSAANDAPILLTNGDAVPPETQDYLGDEADFSITTEPGETAGVLGTNVSADAAQALADALGAELETVQLPGPEAPVEENSGVIVDFDLVGNEYTFVNGNDEVITVEYDETEDDFSVDGAAASAGVFEASLDVGDNITHTPGTEDEAASHDLENVDPTSYTEGTVGSVNTGAQTFAIIEPNTGVELRTAISYTGELYTIDGALAVEGAFEAVLSEGDTIVIDEDENGQLTFNLTNNVVSGEVTGFNTIVADGFQVDATFGDVAEDGEDDWFVLDDATYQQEYTVDGETATLAEILGEISDGDQVTYTREGGVEIFTLVNSTPSTRTGVVNDAYDPGATDEVEVILEDGTTFYYDYATATNPRFLVDGLLVDEATFDAAYSAGDTLMVTPEDVPTNTTALLSLTNANLAGEIDTFTPGANNDGTGTFDVLHESGTVIANVVYNTPPDRLFVDGTEVTEAVFEAEVEDGDSVEIVEGVVAFEIRATLAEDA